MSTPLPDSAPGIVLQPLGDPDAAVCEDGVCEIPGSRSR